MRCLTGTHHLHLLGVPRMSSRSELEIHQWPGATHLKVQTTYHEAFNAKLRETVPWQAMRWEKTLSEGWVIWVQRDYLPVLQALAWWFDRARLYDEDGQGYTDMQSGRQARSAQQLDLFAEGT
jgi:hypothetical protein